MPTRASRTKTAIAPPEGSDIIVPRMSPSPGTQLGPYEIVSQLGSGGMGVVDEARDPRPKRTVATTGFRPGGNQVGDWTSLTLLRKLCPSQLEPV